MRLLRAVSLSEKKGPVCAQSVWMGPFAVCDMQPSRARLTFYFILTQDKQNCNPGLVSYRQ